MPTPERPSSPAYWRCGHCSTPNPWASYLTCCIGCGAPRPSAVEEAPAPGGADPPRAEPRSRRLLWLAAGYGGVVLIACVLARVVGDAWWPGVALQLAPRWAFFLPIVPLGVAAWRSRRPLIGGMLVVEALMVGGPLMGFVVPWGLVGRKDVGPKIRIMTFNRGGGAIDVPRFIRYVERQKVDVICFQEYGDDPALESFFTQGGWHRDKHRSIASRLPIVGEVPRLVENNLDRRRYTAILTRARLEGPGGREIVVGSLHMPTLRPGFQDLLRGDVAGFRLLVDWWLAEMDRTAAALRETWDAPVLIGGDFNNGPESSGFAALVGSGLYQSAFDQAGFGWGYTRPSAVPWARIDHILASNDWSVSSCWVGPDFGSDHRSMVAEVGLPPAQP